MSRLLSQNSSKTLLKEKSIPNLNTYPIPQTHSDLTQKTNTATRCNYAVAFLILYNQHIYKNIIKDYSDSKLGHPEMHFC